jgi:hypothetical protein
VCANACGDEFNGVQKFSMTEVSQIMELSSSMEQIQRMQHELNVHNRENILKKFMRREN